MPNHKEILKKTLILPERNRFKGLSVYDKYHLLSSLSIDNLVRYLNYIFSNNYDGNDDHLDMDGHFIIEQIVDHGHCHYHSSNRNNYNYSSNQAFTNGQRKHIDEDELYLSDWILKHQQQSFAMNDLNLISHHHSTSQSTSTNGANIDGLEIDRLIEFFKMMNIQTNEFTDEQHIQQFNSTFDSQSPSFDQNLPSFLTNQFK